MGFAAITFAIVIGVILATYWVFILRTEEQAQQTLRSRMKKGSVRERARIDVLKATQPSSNLVGLDRVLTRVDRADSSEPLAATKNS